MTIAHASAINNPLRDGIVLKSRTTGLEFWKLVNELDSQVGHKLVVCGYFAAYARSKMFGRGEGDLDNMCKGGNSEGEEERK